MSERVVFLRVVVEATDVQSRVGVVALVLELVLFSLVVPTIAPIVTDLASSFFRVSFISVMLSSRSICPLFLIQHSSSIPFSFCSRIVRMLLPVHFKKFYFSSCFSF